MKKEKGKSIAIVALAAALAASLGFSAVLLARGAAGGQGGSPAASIAAPGTSVPADQLVPPMPEPDSSSLPQWPERPATEKPEDNIPLEIERKFLVEPENLPEGYQWLGKSYKIEQSYISAQPEVRIRRIDDGSQYFFALKLPRDETGLARAEIDFAIDETTYDQLVQMALGTTIHKTRYQFYHGDAYVFVDVYAEALEGLVVVEVQFTSVEEAEAFEPPAWFGEDVTADKRYKNASLALNGLPDPRLLPA